MHLRQLKAGEAWTDRSADLNRAQSGASSHPASRRRQEVDASSRRCSAKGSAGSCKGRHQISKGTLLAAEWVILVTSLAPKIFTTADVFALHRFRWCIELTLKRLKSLIGLKGLPGVDERFPKPSLPGIS